MWFSYVVDEKGEEKTVKGRFWGPKEELLSFEHPERQDLLNVPKLRYPE
jgi:hypothetical protein